MMQDVLGRELQVGDVVLFSTKFGQTAWLKLSIICKITERNNRYGEGTYFDASIMSADLYGTKGAPANISTWRTNSKGYPQLGHGADSQKMFRLCSSKDPGEYITVAKPLILAYNKYVEEQNKNGKESKTVRRTAKTA